MGPHASGVNSILPKEHGSQFFYLPIIKHGEDEVIHPAPGSLGAGGGAALNKMPSVSPLRTDEGRNLVDDGK